MRLLSSGCDVGFYDDTGVWHREGLYVDPRVARARVSALNDFYGGGASTRSEHALESWTQSDMYRDGILRRQTR